MKTLTNREIWALRFLLDFDIARYLMANSCQRLDGGEKADRHISISKTLCKFIFAEGGEYHDTKNVRASYMAVHNFLAEILTDNLDKTIGFPLNTPIYGDTYTPYHEKFFDVIIKNFNEIEEVAQKYIK